MRVKYLAAAALMLLATPALAGGCCGYGSVPVVGIEFLPPHDQVSQIYVVNQGPVLSGPGLYAYTNPWVPAEFRSATGLRRAVPASGGFSLCARLRAPLVSGLRRDRVGRAADVLARGLAPAASSPSTQRRSRVAAGAAPASKVRRTVAANRASLRSLVDPA